MANFIQPADSKIKINEDVSYLPNVGAYAKIDWYSTSSDRAPQCRRNCPERGDNFGFRLVG